jgi:hypothetical protein
MPYGAAKKSNATYETMTRVESKGQKQGAQMLHFITSMKAVALS